MSRRDDCPKCGVGCRVCRNCRFYDASAYHECREAQAEWVKEKDRGNFCGYFEPESRKVARPEADPKAALEGLFSSKAFSDGPKPPTASVLSEQFKNFQKRKKSPKPE